MPSKSPKSSSPEAPTRLKLVVQYKGSAYNGWQTQPNGVTVQETLEKALSRILQHPISVTGSGRTDSGVHALAQTCHFDLPKAFDLNKLLYGLNSILPDDIAVLALQKAVSDFHAQRSTKRKTYDYYLFNSPIRSPFLHDFSWLLPYALDLKKMQKAAKHLVGEHDFKSFCAADSTAKTTVRRIFKIQIKKIPFHAMQALPNLTHPKHGSPLFNPVLILISIEGGGFLKHMVRNIVGTLVEIGKNRMTVPEFAKAFKKADRTQTGPTAPAKGLFMRGARY